MGLPPLDLSYARKLYPAYRRLGVSRSRLCRPGYAHSPKIIKRPWGAVGYHMPVPQYRRTCAWSYTRPELVRGSFVKALAGVLNRRGQMRRTLVALHHFCSRPIPNAPAPARPTRTLSLRVGRGSRHRPTPPAALPNTHRGAAEAWPDSAHINMWEVLRDQPHLAYGLKYCRLSRRVRKILRNKYRYSKYFFMVPPAKRLMVTLHLWKYVLKFYDERTLAMRLAELGKNFDAVAARTDENSLLWVLFYAQQRLALKRLLRH